MKPAVFYLPFRKQVALLSVISFFDLMLITPFILAGAATHALEYLEADV